MVMNIEKNNITPTHTIFSLYMGWVEYPAK